MHPCAVRQRGAWGVTGRPASTRTVEMRVMTIATVQHIVPIVCKKTFVVTIATVQHIVPKASCARMAGRWAALQTARGAV